MKYYAYIIICGLLMCSIPGTSCLSAQSKPGFGEPGFVLPAAHRGPVNVLIDNDAGRLLSAGSDGFLEIWDTSHHAAVDRFQLSLYPIHAMALRPGKTQVGVIERDDLGTYRIAAWDYNAKKQLFTLTFRDRISYLNYSAGGTFLIAVQSGRPALLFIAAETGELLKPPDIAAPVSFAATGRSERTMITYMATGVLSYWDLESGREIRRFTVPSRMQSPLLFSNNRFLGGIDPGGLVILDAVSGAVLAREREVSQGILLSLEPESPEFICLSLAAVFRFTITNAGRLETKRRWTIPRNIPDVTGGAVTADGIALGTATGGVWLGRENGSAKPMAAREQRLIVEVAASGSSLAFLTEDHDLGVIPLDYTRLEQRRTIALEEVPYTQIAGSPDPPAEQDQFMLWQDAYTRPAPLVRTLSQNAGSSRNGRYPVEDTLLDKRSLGFPLRSASLLGDKALFLDALGNATVLSVQTGGVLFSFSSIASQDAVFLNDSHILIGRGALSGTTPFLTVNIVTGETVPLSYPASVGARVYRGAGGVPYGIAIDQSGGALKTAVIRLNTANPSHSAKLFEWEGEDIHGGIAESRGSLAAVLGGQGAFFYDPAQPKPLERSPGLPRRLIDGGAYMIAVDTDGNILWHDPDSGEIRALFHLYKDGWLLEKGGRQAVQGSVAK